MDGQGTLSTSWTTLKPLLNNILVGRRRYEHFEWGYFQVYRAVFFGQGLQLYKLLEAEITKHLISQVWAAHNNAHKQRPHSRLNRQLQKRLSDLEGLPLLAELTKMWKSHKEARSLIAKVKSSVKFAYAFEILNYSRTEILARATVFFRFCWANFWLKKISAPVMTFCVLVFIGSRSTKQVFLYCDNKFVARNELPSIGEMCNHLFRDKVSIISPIITPRNVLTARSGELSIKGGAGARRREEIKSRPDFRRQAEPQRHEFVPGLPATGVPDAHRVASRQERLREHFRNRVFEQNQRILHGIKHI